MMWTRRVGSVAVVSILVLLGGPACNRPLEYDPISQDKITQLERYEEGEDPCVVLAQSPGCDLCDVLGAYSDGFCDKAFIDRGLCHQADPDCVGAEQVCTDRVDNDDNGATDCADWVCKYSPACWPICGNGIVEAGEECDGGPDCTVYCSSSVVTGFCGNVIVEPGEQCDDGNYDSGDGCSPDCQVEGQYPCGNGIVEIGEQCDDGADNSDTLPDACRTDCRDAYCGDGTVDTGEACDGTGCALDCSHELPSD